MSMAVDGNKTDFGSNYAEFGADNRRESSYMQVDLGAVCDVNSLSLIVTGAMVEHMAIQ